MGQRERGVRAVACERASTSSVRTGWGGASGMCQPERGTSARAGWVSENRVGQGERVS